MFVFIIKMIIFGNRYRSLAFGKNDKSNKCFIGSAMFMSKTITMAENKSIKHTLYQDEEQLSYDDFLNHLQENEAFRTFWISLLRAVPFNAYHWETPSVSSSTVYRPFEFVVSDAPGIDIPPVYSPFEKYFTGGGNHTAVFDNLGGDAKLIVPEPLGQDRNYSHIGMFTEQAPDEQQHTLWQTVGLMTSEKLSDQPLWLNTAGGGVAWLHVRLDARPKYYMHRPYCQ